MTEPDSQNASTATEIAPLSKERHAGWSLDWKGRYGFARQFGFLPITLAEMPTAARSLPIFFVREAAGLKPIVLLSVQKGDNHFVQADGTWDAGYVPAVLRQYPFIVGLVESQDQAVLCIDQAYSGFNREGRGSALFDESGEPAEVVRNALEFGRQLARAKAVTDRFCKVLLELDILAPVDLTMKGPAGKTADVRGLQTVSREKLKSLGSERAQDLLKTDMMETLFLQLHSLENLNSGKYQTQNDALAKPHEPLRAPDLRQLG